MTRFPRCLQPCCLATGHCCGCCAAKPADPAVRALTDDLNATFGRMRALEARVLPSTPATQEPCHEHQLANEPTFDLPVNLATGAKVLGASVAPFNSTIATMLETLRTQRT